VVGRLGQAYLRLDRSDEALARLTQAVEMGGADAEILFSRGRVYARQRDLSAARRDFQRALVLDPEGPIGQQAAAELQAMGEG
jgi:Flp pilus assembly protein TadD